METKELRTAQEKNELLDSEVKKMLEADNPLEGIYGMYGDHPNDEDIRNSTKESVSKSRKR